MTGLIGKWHLGSEKPGQSPNDRGFDYFFGFDRAHTEKYESKILSATERKPPPSAGWLIRFLTKPSRFSTARTWNRNLSSSTSPTMNRTARRLNRRRLTLTISKAARHWWVGYPLRQHLRYGPRCRPDPRRTQTHRAIGEHADTLRLGQRSGARAVSQRIQREARKLFRARPRQRAVARLQMGALGRRGARAVYRLFARRRGQDQRGEPKGVIARIETKWS